MMHAQSGALYVRSVCRLSSRVAEVFLFILSALSHMPAVPTDSLPLQCVPSTLSVALSLCQCVPRNSLPRLLPVVMRIRRQSSAGAPSRRYHPAYSYRPRCASSSGYPPRGSAGSPRHSSRCSTCHRFLLLRLRRLGREAPLGLAACSADYRCWSAIGGAPSARCCRSHSGSSHHHRLLAAAASLAADPAAFACLASCPPVARTRRYYLHLAACRHRPQCASAAHGPPLDAAHNTAAALEAEEEAACMFAAEARLLDTTGHPPHSSHAALAPTAAPSSLAPAGPPHHNSRHRCMQSTRRFLYGIPPDRALHPRMRRRFGRATLPIDMQLHARRMPQRWDRRHGPRRRSLGPSPLPCTAGRPL